MSICLRELKQYCIQVFVTLMAFSCFLLHKTPLHISLIQRRRRDDDKACVNPHIQTYIQTFKSLVIDHRYQGTI